MFVPMKVRFGDAVASFISTTTVFGTPTEITLSELVIEAFLPADAETAAVADGAGGRLGRRLASSR